MKYKIINGYLDKVQAGQPCRQSSEDPAQNRGWFDVWMHRSSATPSSQGQPQCHAVLWSPVPCCCPCPGTEQGGLSHCSSCWMCPGRHRSWGQSLQSLLLQTPAVPSRTASRASSAHTALLILQTILTHLSKQDLLCIPQTNYYYAFSF